MSSDIQERVDGPVVGLALRVLANFWLNEVRQQDERQLSALPELADTITSPLDGALETQLAVEYQRLFGFHLPPYESIFVDPSAMLDAPATALVQAAYLQAGWRVPVGVRAAAPDHLGLELMGLAETQIDGPLLTRHLALWLPAFIFSLRRLQPHPFYAALGELTLSLIMEILPEDVLAEGEDPFPSLPPAPVYRGTEDEPERSEEGGEDQMSLNQWVRYLLTPALSGLYLSKRDIAWLGEELDLPVGLGDRFAGLRGLFQLAGQYDLHQQLIQKLGQLFTDDGRMRARLVEEYPAWKPYERAWTARSEQILATIRAGGSREN